jgi:hypothetical protein
MSKPLTIGSETFDFPLQGENAGWGEQVTDWATAVTDALSTVQGPADILLTSANIINNQSTFVNINGFSFSTATVDSFTAQYYVLRSTVSPAAKKVESGTINGNYDGTNWQISIQNTGNADIDFQITSSGQLQYKTDNMVGSSYSGLIKFFAKSIT